MRIKLHFKYLVEHKKWIIKHGWVLVGVGDTVSEAWDKYVDYMRWLGIEEGV